MVLRPQQEFQSKTYAVMDVCGSDEFDKNRNLIHCIIYVELMVSPEVKIMRLNLELCLLDDP